MNDKMVFGQYYNANSLIHKLDPRLKMLALVLLMIITDIINFLSSSNTTEGFFCINNFIF